MVLHLTRTKIFMFSLPTVKPAVKSSDDGTWFCVALKQSTVGSCVQHVGFLRRACNKELGFLKPL